MISANIISGPFYEPFAEASFQSILPLVDEIIVVDTAPGNNPNSEVNKKYATSVLDFYGGGTPEFSFANARELARQSSNHEWILKWDQDEVMHEFDIEWVKNKVKNTSFNGVELAFYHFMMYPWLYQFIDTKRFLFKRDYSIWTSDVHEGVYLTEGRFDRLHDVKVFHYGYLRGQEEVFKRWQLYAEIEGKSDWYNNTNPAHIIEDRIPVCQHFNGEHPQVVKPVLELMFGDVVPLPSRSIPRYNMTDNYVGLLLITYNDASTLKTMLSTLEQNIDYPTIIHVIDMGSTDNTIKLLEIWRSGFLEFPNDKIKDIVIDKWDKLESLSKTMNYGYKSLMSRQECEYIGWIHPDMEFHVPWLKELVATLQVHPEIGKISSFNSRDGIPTSFDIYEGHEQMYIIKRGVLLQIGLFDEKFIGIGGCEDWDMNNRIRQEGFKVAITPKSWVYHKGMGTRERRNTTKEAVHNRIYYIDKWNSTEEVVCKA